MAGSNGYGGWLKWGNMGNMGLSSEQQASLQQAGSKCLGGIVHNMKNIEEYHETPGRWRETEREREGRERETERERDREREGGKINTYTTNMNQQLYMTYYD